VICQPKPLQNPSIPIEVGGTAKAALRRAGRLGDGWIEIGSSDLDDFGAKLALVNEARRQAGRESEPFEVTVSGTLDPGLDGFRRLRDTGATRIVVRPRADASGRLTLEGCQQWAEQFAAEIIDPFD
jgi:alkanesulfonate monooxygenase SsuD/methylene tetrahydromethanopterin reductase-like flavin-dependent oxidoreductase (luciferase family)